MENETMPSEPVSEKLKIAFHGSAGEYFRIWIVNLALTVLTLGIYSAWAKVRSKKYLYGNVEMAGARFDYHGNPMKILKGRILIGILFLGYSVGGKISMAVSAGFAILFSLIFPWLIVRALIFALANTSYRNIRFGFKKDYKESYLVYVKSTVIGILSLGLGYPYASYLQTNFRTNRIRFGNQYFSFKSKAGDFFRIYYGSFGIIIAASVASGLLFFLFRETRLMVLVSVPFYLGIVLSTAFLKASLANLLGNNTQFGVVKLHCTLKPVELMGIYITNMIGCILSLGLAIPWATIRTFKYRLDHTLVITQAESLGSITAQEQTDNPDAKADAAVDFWDLDLGI